MTVPICTNSCLGSPTTLYFDTGLWVKNQLNMYRNGLEGKLPALSSERTSMLEELGICWGERRKTIPWDERFQALLDYKVRYGFFLTKQEESMHGRITT